MKDNDEAMKFYTGFRSYHHLCYVFGCLGPAAMHLKWASKCLSPREEFFLTLIKLRLNRSDLELGFMFHISRKVAGQIFSTWINFMYHQVRSTNIDCCAFNFTIIYF